MGSQRGRGSAGDFDFDGHRVYYETFGEGERVLVYANGLLLDTQLNQGIAHALAARGNRVVLLDLLGHGRSDKPMRQSLYRMDVYGLQMLAVLEHLGLDSAVLGGVSLGANVCLEAVHRKPSAVRGLVIEMPVLENAVPAAALAFVPVLLAARHLSGAYGLGSRLVKMFPRTPVAALNSVLDAGSAPPEIVATVLQGVLGGPVGPREEDREAIRCPAVIIGHRRDLIHPFSDAAQLCEQIRGARLLEAISPMELRILPRRLTGEIADFLDEVWAPMVAEKAS